MTRYGKLSDGVLTFAPRPLVIDGQHVFTDDPSIYSAQGYKPIEYTEPEIPEGYEATATWEEDETRIYQVWEYTPVPEPEPAQDWTETEAALEEMGVRVYE